MKCGFNNVIIDRDIARTDSLLLINISIHTILYFFLHTILFFFICSLGNSSNFTGFALRNLLSMLNLQVSVANLLDSTIRF